MRAIRCETCSSVSPRCLRASRTAAPNCCATGSATVRRGTGWCALGEHDTGSLGTRCRTEHSTCSPSDTLPIHDSPVLGQRDACRACFGAFGVRHRGHTGRRVERESEHSTTGGVALARRFKLIICGVLGVSAVAVAGCGASTRTVIKTITAAKVAPTAPATSGANIVLGSKRFVSGGEGWGTSQPSKIYNGGDRSGLVAHIRWSNWGQSVALGSGMHAIFKPEGGYYSQLVPITLRAYDIGTCTSGSPRAYLKLSTRQPVRPGGPLGSWSSWTEAPNLCSYETGASTTSSITQSTSTPSTPPASTPAPQTFTGNGVQNLGTISVPVASTLHWSCPECRIFSVTGASEGAAVIALDSQKHTSGITAVEPGTYHSVDVQAYGEAGVAGEWTITITPQG
jgi:hypothetical protein